MLLNSGFNSWTHTNWQTIKKMKNIGFCVLSELNSHIRHMNFFQFGEIDSEGFNGTRCKVNAEKTQCVFNVHCQWFNQIVNLICKYLLFGAQNSKVCEQNTVCMRCNNCLMLPSTRWTTFYFTITLALCIWAQGRNEYKCA